MFNQLLFFAELLRPNLKNMSEDRRLAGAGDVLSFVYSLPLAILGLIWLVIETNTSVLFQQWPMMSLILALVVVFSLVNYFIIVEIRADRYGSADGSLAGMVVWSGVLLFGPTSLWILVLWQIFRSAWRWREAVTPSARWNLARNLTFDLTSATLAFLIPLSLYQNWGGQFPLGPLSLATIIPAFGAITIHFVLIVLIWSGYILYHLTIQKILSSNNSILPILIFFFLSFGLPYLAHPFAILATSLYTQNGLEVYLFFLSGMFLVAYLARRLSWTAESNRQKSRQLERLELLGREIINAPPNPSYLPDILGQHLPNMFPSGHIAIWIEPGHILYKNPPDWPAAPEKMWQWVLDQTGSHAFLSNDRLPWEDAAKHHNAIVVAPVQKIESGRPFGGIYLELRTLVQPWDARSLEALFPAIQSLAAQIASAFHQFETYNQMLAYHNMTQELQLAGKIQASFLPNKFPSISGWQLAVSMLPAREMSGDFFDVIELPDGRLGILIADVADKGVGPALYMALSRTLIRTYALEYDAEPEVVFFAANNRILRDARANLFVTAFYGVLDPVVGTLTYCNAGHNPPYLISPSLNGAVKSLDQTGIPIGIEEETTWTQETVNISPGDLVLLYTDGIPDAQNDRGDFFNDDRLIDLALANINGSAYDLQRCILDEVQKFYGDSPQSDDITLMILLRDS